MFKIKKARASRALRRALDPGHISFSPFLIMPPDFITKNYKNTLIVQCLPLPCNIVATFKSFLISVGTIKGKIAFIGGEDINLLNFNRRCPENQENTYLKKRNARASTALRWALDPSQLGFASLT